MLKQSAVDFCQPLEDLAISEEVFAHLHKRANDLDTHRYGLFAVQNRGGHDRAMLGEGIW